MKIRPVEAELRTDGRTDRRTLRVAFPQFCDSAQEGLWCADCSQQGATVTACLAVAMCKAIQTAAAHRTPSGDTKCTQYGRSTEGHGETNSVRLLAVSRAVG